MQNNYLIDLYKKDSTDILIFLFWTISIFLSVFYLPKILGIIISIFLAFYSYFTKKDIVVLLLFSVIALGIGGIFTVNQLPRVSLGLGMALNTTDMMIIAIFLKIFPHKIFSKGLFSKFFIFFFIYIIINFVINSYLIGLDLDIGLNLFRIFFYYILYFYTLYSIKEIKDFSLIIKMFFFIMLLVFVFQLLFFFVKIDIRAYLSTGTIAKVAKYSASYGAYDRYKTDAVRATVNDVLTPFLVFILSLSLINTTIKKKWNTIFFLSIIIWLISIFISATRVWSVISFVTLLGFLKFKTNIKKSVKIVSFTILLFIFIFPLIGSQSLDFIHDILLRLSGVIKIAQGKINKVGTALSRLYQLKQMWKFIPNRPFFGYGFTKISLKETNTNFGFLNTLLVFGFLGLIIIIYLLIRYISICNVVLKKISDENPYYKIIKVFLFAWYAIIIAYAFTWDFFTLRIRAVIFMSLFLGFTDFFLREAIFFENKYVIKNNLQGKR